MHNFAIVGPESTGKSTLAIGLAQKYNTLWVPEYARNYLEKLQRPYDASDFREMAARQLNWEQSLMQHANNAIFCDTNLLVLKVWYEHSYKKNNPWLDAKIAATTYTHHFLSDIDIPWAPDPQREHPHLRAYFFKVYEDLLINLGLPYTIVQGDLNQRIAICSQVIDREVI